MIDNKYINEIKGINIYISEESKVSDKAKILFNSLILGKSEIKDDAVIGPNTILIDSVVHSGAQIINSLITNSVVGERTTVGPFAHLRDNTIIKNDCRIGNFVEVKKSKIDDKSKVSHLAYIGDSEIGVNCNFGCGSITVNYDGINKHKTTIGDNVFIGCNTNLVAPVTICNNSFIACGSTITADVPENTLAIARSRQLNKIDYYK
jgi:bifunctional UDP-N-acetylglucosamine pyrophosphorylase/glucosamine-1-phosphate N-acetyltransferase